MEFVRQSYTELQARLVSLLSSVSGHMLDALFKVFMGLLPLLVVCLALLVLYKWLMRVVGANPDKVRLDIGNEIFLVDRDFVDDGRSRLEFVEEVRDGWYLDDETLESEDFHRRSERVHERYVAEMLGEDIESAEEAASRRLSERYTGAGWDELD